MRRIGWPAALVAAGVAFGLGAAVLQRADDPVDTPPATRDGPASATGMSPRTDKAVAPNATSSTSSPDAPGPVGGRVPRAATTPQGVRAQAQAALDVARPEIAAACWTPPGADAPASIVLTVDVTFSPTGEVLTLAHSEQREASRPEVTRCVQGRPRPILAIAAPGDTVRTTLTLTLP